MRMLTVEMVQTSFSLLLPTQYHYDLRQNAEGYSMEQLSWQKDKLG